MVVLKGVVSYPIPAYQNVAINANFYQPSQFTISAIALGPTTLVTTSVAHNYVLGQEIRLLIPPSFGCIQLNGAQGYVVNIPTTTQVTVSINSSSNVGAFISSSSTVQSATILAIGDISNGAINATGLSSQGTFIPGSFIDISPL